MDRAEAANRIESFLNDVSTIDLALTNADTNGLGEYVPRKLRGYVTSRAKWLRNALAKVYSVVLDPDTPVDQVEPAAPSPEEIAERAAAIRDGRAANDRARPGSVKPAE